MQRLIDKLSKKITGYTPQEIAGLETNIKKLNAELEKIPLHEQYNFGIQGKKGFSFKNEIFKEKDINNSSNRIPEISPLSICVGIIGEAGSGKSLLASKVLSTSKKILYLGVIDKDYYDKAFQRNFRLKIENEVFTFETKDKTYFSHEIDFCNEDKKDVISIDTYLYLETIDESLIKSCYSVFETFIFKAIKNGYSIVFDERFMYLNDLFKTDKFSELIAFAYDRLKLEIDQLKIEAINNDAKIIIILPNRIFRDTLFNHIDCSYYIDELILMDYFNNRRIESFQELQEKYLFFVGNYFKYTQINHNTKVGDYIHFEKLKSIK